LHDLKKKVKIMSATEIIENQFSGLQESLAEANRTLGALHILIKCAKAEAESANATDAARTLQMATALLIHGDIAGCGCDGVTFGKV